MACKHEEFDAEVDVNRFPEADTFTAHVKIVCKMCRVPFFFNGLPQDHYHLAAAIDGRITAKLDITPAWKT